MGKMQTKSISNGAMKLKNPNMKLKNPNILRMKPLCTIDKYFYHIEP